VRSRFRKSWAPGTASSLARAAACGNTLPRDEIDSDVRPDGFQRWTKIAAAQPDLLVHIHIDLTDVADGEFLEGVMHVTGRLPDDTEPFETRFRVDTTLLRIQAVATDAEV
jgi:hypothetical protein